VKGRDIFISLCEAPDPEAALRKLDRKALRRLADWFDALRPTGGFAALAEGMTILECARRWRDKSKHETQEAEDQETEEGHHLGRRDQTNLPA